MTQTKMPKTFFLGCVVVDVQLQTLKLCTKHNLVSSLILYSHILLYLWGVFSIDSCYTLHVSLTSLWGHAPFKQYAMHTSQSVIISHRSVPPLTQPDSQPRCSITHLLCPRRRLHPDPHDAAVAHPLYCSLSLFLTFFVVRHTLHHLHI